VMLVTKGRRAAINPVSGNGKPKISGPLTLLGMSVVDSGETSKR